MKFEIKDNTVFFPEYNRKARLCIGTITDQGVHEDPAGDVQYFYVPDIYFTGKNSLDRFRGFKLYPEHAVRAITEGHGDVIQQSNILGFSYTHVLYFLDRTIGEPLRQKTIEGWKDTKYKYAIFYRDVAYNKNGEYYKGDQTLLFDTEEEAWAKIKEFCQEIDAVNEEFEKNLADWENKIKFSNTLIENCFLSDENCAKIVVQQIPF